MPPPPHAVPPLPKWQVYADLVFKFWASMPTFFEGSAAIDQLMALKLAVSREHANSLCVAMLQDGVFLRVGSPPAAFRDDHARYRLTWSTAEETRSNVAMQRAPAMPASAVSLQRPRMPSQFDDHLSEESGMQEPVFEALQTPPQQHPKTSPALPFSVRRVRDLDRLGSGSPLQSASPPPPRVNLTHTPPSPSHVQQDAARASSPPRQADVLRLRAQLELLKSTSSTNTNANNSNAGTRVSNVTNERHVNNSAQHQHQHQQSPRVRPTPQPQRAHLTFRRRRNHHIHHNTDPIYHQRSASIDMPTGNSASRSSLERPMNHAMDSGNAHPLKRLARSCSVDGGDRRRRSGLTRSTSVDTRGGMRRRNIDWSRTSLPRDADFAAAPGQPGVASGAGAATAVAQGGPVQPWIGHERISSYESDFDAADDDSVVYGQPAARAFTSSVTEAGSVGPISKESEPDLPNMSTIREKLKRAFQDDKNKHNKTTTTTTDGKADEPRRLEPELMASMGNEGSPITTPRKPWRILRVLSGKTETISSTLSDDETFTDKEREKQSPSLKDKLVRSLRRGRGWAGRDAFEDRRDPMDHQHQHQQSHHLRRWRS